MAVEAEVGMAESVQAALATAAKADLDRDEGQPRAVASFRRSKAAHTISHSACTFL
jgi:hypothetical protein